MDAQRLRYGLGLTALFSLCFVLPVYVILYIGENENEEALKQTAQLVPINEQFSFERLGESLTISPQAAALNPSQYTNFLLTIWLKPQKLPEPGKKYIFLSKYDADSPSRAGFALAIENRQGVVFPSLYWMNDEGSGGWFPFLEINILRKNWFMLAFESTLDGSIGMYAIVRSPDKGREIKLLGGHKIESEGDVLSESPLKIGAYHSEATFTGDIGPVGIFSEIPGGREVIAQLLENPFQLPVEREKVLLWLHKKNDVELVTDGLSIKKSLPN